MSSSNNNTTNGNSVDGPGNKWYMYYGYIVDTLWLMKYGVSNKLDPGPATKDDDYGETERIHSIISSALGHILLSSVWSTAKSGSVAHNGKSEYCIVLATNDPEDHRSVPPPEQYALLKQILQTEKDPEWYRAIV